MQRVPINLVEVNGETNNVVSPVIWDKGFSTSNISVFSFIRNIHKNSNLAHTIDTKLSAFKIQVEHNKNKASKLNSEAYNLGSKIEYLEQDMLRINKKYEEYTAKIDSIAERLPDLRSVKKTIRETYLYELERNYTDVQDSVAYLSNKKESNSINENRLEIASSELSKNSIRVSFLLKSLIENTKKYKLEVDSIDEKLNVVSKLTVSINKNLTACFNIFPIVYDAIESLSNKYELNDKFLLQYSTLIENIHSIYLKNVGTLDELEERLKKYSDSLEELSCELEIQKTNLEDSIKTCDEASRLLDYYYNMFNGMSFAKAGENIRLNRVGCVLIISADLPPLKDCPKPPMMPQKFGDVSWLQDEMPYCPPVCTKAETIEPIEPITKTKEPKECEFFIIDGNDNRIIDDDLDLYIDNRFIKTFYGTVQASTTHNIEIKEGTRKFKFVFKKANGKNTIKEIYVIRKSDNKVLYSGQLGCFSDTPIGTTIWEANIKLSCE